MTNAEVQALIQAEVARRDKERAGRICRLLEGRTITKVQAEQLIDFGDGRYRLAGKVLVQLDSGAAIISDPMDFSATETGK